MKSLILADLHYSPERYGSKVMSLKLKEESEKQKFDSVLLCGDNAIITKDMSNYFKLFDFLRENISEEIGFVAGNHDLWGKPFDISSEKLLYEIYPRIADSEGINYLEGEIMKIDDSYITGTYGHYDYSFAMLNDKLRIENIKNFEFQGIKWVDKWRMQWNSEDKAICYSLVHGLEERIEKIEKNRKNEKIITISHTIPARKFSGHPENAEQNFVSAYIGSNYLGKVLQSHNIDYHFCGHTHRYSQGMLGKCLIINIGSDYDMLKYALLDTEKKKIKIF